jgi:hypothetical protein
MISSDLSGTGQNLEFSEAASDFSESGVIAECEAIEVDSARNEDFAPLHIGGVNKR